MAGKDRTGLLVALVLAVAGIPRDEIVQNYALSRFAAKMLRENIFRHWEEPDFVPFSSVKPSAEPFALALQCLAFKT